MSPSCYVDPMDCMFLHKRAPPVGVSPVAPPPSSQNPNVTVIVAASVGSLALVLVLSVFYCCMRKRRASRRIGQLQRFLPTFMDQEKTAKYFQSQGSSTMLVLPADPSQPSNVHHRTRSAPLAFAKTGGGGDKRSRQLEREGSMSGPFQQISLISEETVVEDSPPRRSISGGSTRARATTVNTASIAVTPLAPVMSSLHRSVSLNKHSPSSPINSRSNPMVMDDDEDPQERFPEGESLVAPNRFSTLLEFNDNRFSSTSSTAGLDPDFDPTRFSTNSGVFDAKRISNQSHASSSDESISTNSSVDEFKKQLPPHQQHHSFHTHDNSSGNNVIYNNNNNNNNLMSSSSPAGRNREASGAEYPASVAAAAQSYYGDKQELEDDEEFIPRRGSDNTFHYNNNSGQYYPPLSQQQQLQQMPQPMSMPLPTHMPMPMPAQTSPRATNRAGVPLPASIRMTRPQSRGPEMNVTDDDRQQNPRY